MWSHCRRYSTGLYHAHHQRPAHSGARTEAGDSEAKTIVLQNPTTMQFTCCIVNMAKSEDIDALAFIFQQITNLQDHIEDYPWDEQAPEYNATNTESRLENAMFKTFFDFL